MDAQKTCEQTGGGLVVIHSEEENTFVKSLIWPAFKKTRGAVWFGASDREKEKHWKWINGQGLKYSAFHPGEPNNCCGGQDCGQFLYYGEASWNSLYWDDGKCTFKNPFICKICPSGWTSFSFSCYKFFSYPQTWTDAQSTCEAVNGNLVIIDSAGENTFVKSLIWPAYKKTRGSVWIGASDREKEGDWKWVNGEGLKYRNFHHGEPNNCCGGQDCGQFLYWNEASWNSLGWDDGRCTFKQPFICEI